MGRQWGPGAFSRCHAALPLPLPLRLLRLRPPLRRGRRRARPVRRRPADRRLRRSRGGGRPLGRARLARPRRPPWRRRVDPQGQLPRRTLELSPTLLLTCAGLPLPFPSLPSSSILTDVWLLFRRFALTTVSVRWRRASPSTTWIASSLLTAYR